MNTEDPQILLPSSFRDPSGFLFTQRGILFRQINQCAKDDYNELISSGLYKELVDKGLLVSHVETDKPAYLPENAFKIIRPELIPFISYPYEWSFSQLKDAALLTLEIQKISIEHGMTLKDASGFNIQFIGYRPVFIDTLSFSIYEKDQPWIAYRQFCKHFLATLSLMRYKDITLNRLLSLHIDGIPLELASTLLPFKTCLNIGLFLHIHCHARSEKYYANETDLDKLKTSRPVSKRAQLGIIDNLLTTIQHMQAPGKTLEWTDYYSNTNYETEAFKEKQKFVETNISSIKPKMVWDLGANVGVFSELAAKYSKYVLAMDMDATCVENNFQRIKHSSRLNILPLVIDLSNPSPAIGWQNKERDSLLQRGPVDIILALALIHHLVISNNLTMPQLCKFFSETCDNLIIEFVPKSDSQVKKLLMTREDIFTDYNQSSFENTFLVHFDILNKQKLSGSERTIYLMRKITNTR